jgi:hypothetical protein
MGNKTQKRMADYSVGCTITLYKDTLNTQAGKSRIFEKQQQQIVKTMSHSKGAFTKK